MLLQFKRNPQNSESHGLHGFDWIDQVQIPPLSRVWSSSLQITNGRQFLASST